MRRAIVLGALLAPALGQLMASAAAPQQRLELTAADHDDVVPETVGAERSTWRIANRPTAVAEGAASTPLEIPTREIVRWGEWPPWPTGPVVLLIDGGVIAGRIESAAEQTIVIQSVSLGRLELPAAAVLGFRDSSATGPAMLALRPDGSTPPRALPSAATVVLTNGDRIAAHTIAWQGDTLAVDAAAGAFTIPTRVVQAFDIAMPQPADRAASQQILAALGDGSRFVISDLRSTASENGLPTRIALTLHLQEQTLAAVCDAEDCVALAVDGGSTRFLGRLEPAVYEQSSQFGPAWPLARGHSLTGDWPACRGDTGFATLGIHAPARVRYHLEPPADRFESLVAIDDSAGTGGSVVIRVMAHSGNAAPREVFVSPVIRGGGPPLAILAELQAATEIELVVESADDSDILDRTLWLDPRVITTVGQ